MKQLSTGLQEFFNQYEKAFNNLDTEGQMKLFGDNFISAGPGGVIAPSKSEFKKMADKAAKFYESLGKGTTKIIDVEEHVISDEYSLVKVHWGTSFKKAGDKILEFNVSYVVNKIGEPKIILFITHEDEQKQMKELGLTTHN